MSIRYILDNENEFVLYEISGTVSPKNIADMSHQIMSKIDKDNSYKEFYLFSDTTAYWAASKAYYEQITEGMAQRDKEHGFQRQKTALVALDPYGKLAIPLWKAVANRDDAFQGETEVFENIEVAVEWLGVELADVQTKIKNIKFEPTY